MPGENSIILIRKTSSTQRIIANIYSSRYRTPRTIFSRDFPAFPDTCETGKAHDYHDDENGTYHADGAHVEKQFQDIMTNDQNDKNDELKDVRPIFFRARYRQNDAGLYEQPGKQKHRTDIDGHRVGSKTNKYRKKPSDELQTLRDGVTGKSAAMLVGFLRGPIHPHEQTDEQVAPYHYFEGCISVEQKQICNQTFHIHILKYRLGNAVDANIGVRAFFGGQASLRQRAASACPVSPSARAIFSAASTDALQPERSGSCAGGAKRR